jgi:hypothetical protein
MIGWLLSAIFTTFLGPIYDRDKMSIFGIFEHFCKVSGTPKFIPTFIGSEYLLKNSQTSFLNIFRHDSVWIV